MQCCEKRKQLHLMVKIHATSFHAWKFIGNSYVPLLYNTSSCQSKYWVESNETYINCVLFYLQFYYITTWCVTLSMDN